MVSIVRLHFLTGVDFGVRLGDRLFLSLELKYEQHAQTSLNTRKSCNHGLGTREVAQLLRALEDLDSIPSTHMTAYKYL